MKLEKIVEEIQINETPELNEELYMSVIIDPDNNHHTTHAKVSLAMCSENPEYILYVMKDDYLGWDKKVEDMYNPHVANKYKAVYMFVKKIQNKLLFRRIN